MENLVVSLEHELQRVLGEERNPLAWLLAWREFEDEKTLAWRVEAVHPEVDMDCNPVKIGDIKEYTAMNRARRNDGFAVMVNLQIDFGIDPMKKELDYVDIAHAIQAARDSEAYRLDKMMRQISWPECLDKLEWHEGKEEVPEKGMAVLWELEYKDKHYMWRSRFYQVDDYCSTSILRDEDGYLDIEDGGDKIVHRWAYLPIPKEVRENEMWKDQEKAKPNPGEWVLVVKKWKGPFEDGPYCIYDMSTYEEGKGWVEYTREGRKEKTALWARLPDLGW